MGNSVNNIGILLFMDHLTLFESSTKFNSGIGWPSYYHSIGKNVKSKLDLSIKFMSRQEVIWGACGAHFGHIFDDGPPWTNC